MTLSGSGSILRSRNLERAAAAYQQGDLNLSRAAHAPARRIDEEPHKSNSMKQVGSKLFQIMVTNGSYGLITSSIVLVGMMSALLNHTEFASNALMQVITSAITVVVASALSLGFVDAGNKRSEIAFYKSEKKRETWEYDNYLEGEQREMVELYMNKGMNQLDAEAVVVQLSKYRELFIDIMMAEELQLMPVDDRLPPLEIGVTTSLSFVLFGVIPLTPMITSEYYHLQINPTTLYYTSIALTTATLFVLGILKSSLGTSKWWVTSFFHVANGLIAIVSALVVGAFLGQCYQ